MTNTSAAVSWTAAGTTDTSGSRVRVGRRSSTRLARLPQRCYPRLNLRHPLLHPPDRPLQPLSTFPALWGCGSQVFLITSLAELAAPSRSSCSQACRSVSGRGIRQRSLSFRGARVYGVGKAERIPGSHTLNAWIVETGDIESFRFHHGTQACPSVAERSNRKGFGHHARVIHAQPLTGVVRVLPQYPRALRTGRRGEGEQAAEREGR